MCTWTTHTTVKRSKQTLAIIKSKICASHSCATQPWNRPYMRNFTLYLTCRFISLSHAVQWLGDLATESSKLTALSIDRINAWWGWRSATSELLSWATRRSHHQPVKTHCDKDMHSWSRMAVFRARISWLVRSGAGWSVCSNFFPWVKVRSSLRLEQCGDCQLHWSQETSPHLLRHHGCSHWQSSHCLPL